MAERDSRLDGGEMPRGGLMMQLETMEEFESRERQAERDFHRLNGSYTDVWVQTGNGPLQGHWKRWRNRAPHLRLPQHLRPPSWPIPGVERGEEYLVGLA